MNHFVIKVANTFDEKEKAYALRKLVFADEQGIPADLDKDYQDAQAIHLIGIENDEIIATGRLYVSDLGGHLSRIAVHKSFRKKGLGKKVIEALIQKSKELKLNYAYLFPHAHLAEFYKSLGFSVVEGYSEQIVGHEIIKMEMSLA